MSQTLPIGAVLRERYEIIDLVGQGGMGAVYKANDQRLRGRICAEGPDLTNRVVPATNAIE